ncbi:hypothetical protein SAMN05443665_106218 [Actinomadura meyerae]|jgi:hypothetical protein|uniref:DUF5753 domain-containing protein n=1 Tax=Actinomadura meyerae TaxID=240840 RepID=A0A239P2G3_9ACTN|nr:hypothetical protein [Actinomadura meyerae]SNT61190.1 hypothetical protein SAMN05443665_106218 [Actinomadura meyerae]
MSRADALRPDFSLWHLIAVEPAHISLDPADIQEQEIRYDSIGMSALTVEASRAFIAKTLDSIS